MAKFMLILHSKPNGMANLAPSEIEPIVAKYHAWFEKMKATGRYVASDKLGEEGGRILTQQQGRLSITRFRSRTSACG